MLNDLEKIREALEYYADRSIYKKKDGFADISFDYGHEAAEALTTLNSLIERLGNMTDIIQDSIRQESGGHSLTNLNGDKLWYAELPINLTKLQAAIKTITED